MLWLVNVTFFLKIKDHILTKIMVFVVTSKYSSKFLMVMRNSLEFQLNKQTKYRVQSLKKKLKVWLGSRNYGKEIKRFLLKSYKVYISGLEPALMRNRAICLKDKFKKHYWKTSWSRGLELLNSNQWKHLILHKYWQFKYFLSCLLYFCSTPGWNS